MPRKPTITCDYADLRGFCRWMLNIDKEPPREYWHCVTCGEVSDRKSQPRSAEDKKSGGS